MERGLSGLVPFNQTIEREAKGAIRRGERE